MPHATVEGVVMCAEPAPPKDREPGARIEFGCCQPGTEMVELGPDKIELEFCEKHAVARWREELEQVS